MSRENDRPSVGNVILVIVILIIAWVMLFGGKITIPFEVTYTITTETNK